jgi:TRAP-type C4-dicarboxylate transport system substrate-binding protein
MMSNPPRRRLLGAAACAAAALARPHVARAAIRTLRLGHGNPDTGLFGDGSRAFAAAVAAHPALSGAVRIVVHGHSELGEELTLVKGCVDGTVDLALVSNVVTGNVVREVDYLYAPFLFADAAAAQRALDGSVGAELTGLCRQRGLHVLAWGENGLRHIGANNAVRTVADLHGLKIRVPQSQTMIDGFRALGAEPGPLSFGMLREALRSGQFQALENSIASFEASKLYEMTSQLCLTGHSYDSVAFAASGDLLEDLTPEQVQALTECAAKGAAVTRQSAAAANEGGLARLAAKMTLVRDVDVAGMRAASRSFIEGLATGDTTGFVKRLILAAR